MSKERSVEWMSFVLGLTGGIATGKSTVVNIFREYGFPIVDSDLIAREIVEIGKPALAAIKATFGKEVLLPEGGLDRKKLGHLIFTHPEKRAVLDQLLAPFLRKAILEQIAQAKQKSNLVIVDIPLLFEAGYSNAVDEIAIVYVPEALQLRRLMKRDQLSEEEAQKRIDSQWPIEEKKEKSQIIFDNQTTIAETKAQVVNWLTANQYI